MFALELWAQGTRLLCPVASEQPRGWKCSQGHAPNQHKAVTMCTETNSTGKGSDTGAQHSKPHFYWSSVETTAALPQMPWAAPALATGALQGLFPGARGHPLAGSIAGEAPGHRNQAVGCSRVARPLAQGAWDQGAFVRLLLEWPCAMEVGRWRVDLGQIEG